jgi:1-aminocyclopropane-1-carboxylate deaminase
MMEIPLHINTSIVQDSLFVQKKVSLHVLRLDELHEHVSGNKLFKLHYFLQQVKQENKKGIVTFGGAYSNHLVATAFACQQQNIQAIGIIRGEKPATLSHTLQQCLQFNMQLHFVSRASYASFEAGIFEDFLAVPEGGFGTIGANGAAHIMNYINHLPYTHVCCAVGTATTLAGLCKQNTTVKNIIAVPAIKNMTDISDRLQQMGVTENNFAVENSFHFGGYAKYTNELLNFMNWFYQISQVPTDFVYTGKLMYTIFKMIDADYFDKGSNIICIHTGGLQGNLSLPKNSLVF